jgi:phytoene dehydrogenase-like protein
VFLTAYPEAQKVLAYDPLELRDFRQGAVVRWGESFRVMPNPMREPLRVFQALAAPFGSLSDKLRVMRLLLEVRAKGNDELLAEKATDTYSYLQAYGWSEKMIQTFFKPFFGGVFLERELQTASSFFRFVFKQFWLSDVCLPAQGIQAIPEQIAQGLPAGAIRLGVGVRQVDDQSVTLEGGEQIQASAVVLAADGEAAALLLPDRIPKPAFRMTTCVYFTAPKSPLRHQMLVLNPNDQDLIHNLCVPTDIAPSYAADGRALVSVSTQGNHGMPEEELVPALLKELRQWFGPDVDRWHHLKSYFLPQALPQYPPQETTRLPLQLKEHLYRCGDYAAYPSLNGAMQTGREVAQLIIAQRK